MSSTKNQRQAEAAPANARKTVAFIVPAHNEQRHIQRCLQSIQSQIADNEGEMTASILVIDNQSDDETAQIALRCGVDVVGVPPGNPGRARNAGVSAVDAEWVAFVDADCVLPAGWLMQCLNHFQDRQVVAVGAVQAAAATDARWVERVWVSTITANKRRSQTRKDWEPAAWLPAFNLLVRRADFNAVGGFDETLDTCEDSDLSFRLAERGELRREYQCPVRHLGESQSLTEFFRRELWRSRGNFHSARKRGSMFNEFASLFLPSAYLLLLLLAPIASCAALLYGGWWSVVAVVTIVSLVAVPLAITVCKHGWKHFGATAALVSVYLIARALGPLLQGQRVSRP